MGLIRRDLNILRLGGSAGERSLKGGNDILAGRMRFLFSVLPLMLLSHLPAPAFGPQNNFLTPAEERGGWTLLFDGKSMNNWVDPSQKSPPGDAWEVTADGCLHALAHPKITEDLFSSAVYRDFELSFEWRISKAGNSGVKYRIQDHKFLLPDIEGEFFEAKVERTMVEVDPARRSPGQDYVIGFEYQITDNALNSDAVHAGPKHSTGALYDMVAPLRAKPMPVGQFNNSRIVVKGMHVEHWLNGVRVVNTMLNSRDVIAGIKKRWGTSPMVAELLEKEPKRDCPISLQNHGDEAWFRNIKIKKL